MSELKRTKTNINSEAGEGAYLKGENFRKLLLILPDGGIITKSDKGLFVIYLNWRDYEDDIRISYQAQDETLEAFTLRAANELTEYFKDE